MGWSASQLDAVHIREDRTDRSPADVSHPPHVCRRRTSRAPARPLTQRRCATASAAHCRTPHRPLRTRAACAGTATCAHSYTPTVRASTRAPPLRMIALRISTGCPRSGECPALMSGESRDHRRHRRNADEKEGGVVERRASGPLRRQRVEANISGEKRCDSRAEQGEGNLMRLRGDDESTPRVCRRR